MKKYIYIIMCLFLVGCQEDAWDVLPSEVQAWIGKAVNFNATVAEEFKHQTRTTYNDTGVFNENDMMRIYRQYAYDSNETGAVDANKDGWDDKVAYRTYYFNTKYATGTQISLGTDWKVWKDRKGLGRFVGEVADYTNPFVQTDADSITWENGKTVRFRSWSRSNFSNSLNGNKDNYYPDFCISDWVTVSGPTEQIPLTLRHICSRIAISYRDNYANQIYKVELADTLDDYRRIDNADTNANDALEIDPNKTQEQAQEEYDAVMDAYNRMCMPAGVDIDKSELYAMKKTFWGGITNEQLQKLEESDPNDTDKFFRYGAGAASDVKDDVQRPLFTKVNTACYLVTIPYDMSNGGTQGDVITLPACTRFRVYMRDVNNGDGNNTNEYEGTYHIFSLQDIKSTEKDAAGNYLPMFPNGLDMLPGYSYKFYVGYRYDKLTITASDNFSWSEQDLGDEWLAEDTHEVPEPTPADYSWWKTTIKNAIPSSTGGDFEPVFHISTQQEFIEFIKLVNGTAAIKTEGLYRAKRAVVNDEHKDNLYDKYYHWYTGVSDNKRDTFWVTSVEATALGYLLYESYHAANGPQPAYSQEEYIRGAYPFYDETRDRHYTIYLDNDLDLYDWQLPSIGEGTDAEHCTPFKGFFDGQMHTIKNLYMEDEYMFKYIDAAAIRNLRIESTHKVSLVKEGTNTCYIVGIDLRAHSTQNSIAERLTTNLYNNPSYVVGCIHVGDAGGALVGASGSLYMYGCMQAAEGIASNTGALLGSYLRYSDTYPNYKFFEPQISFDFQDMNAKLKGTPKWGRFMCNYYDTQLSLGTNAVANIADLYSPLEYIRGRESFILKAKNDNVLMGDVTFNALKSYLQRLSYYGLAPWKAMNYGIYKYNTESGVGGTHPCRAHYENNSTGYVHKYPELISGAPAAEQYANPLEQNN